jgi:prepilin-type N-terminal cleavage/methylation domain-containing protein
MKAEIRSVDSTFVNWRERRESGRGGRGDAGFTLLEVVVSLVIFAILSSAAIAMVLTALQVGRSNRARVVAAQLAARQLEEVRGMRTQDIPTGVTALPNVTTSGTTFHVSQNADYVNSNGTSNACDSPSGASLGYKQVTVTVTWNGMGSVKPVRDDTLKTLSIAGSDPTKGSLAVSVRDNDSNPLANQAVTLSPSGGTQTTGTDGCVVFTGLAPGSGYSASLNAAGYVDINGLQNSIQGSQTVNAGQITKVQFAYDIPASLAISWSAPSGGATPLATPFASLPITLKNTQFPNNGKKAFLDCSDPNAVVGSCVTGTPRTITGLFPSNAGYGIYGGTCLDAAPVTAPGPAAVNPGQSTAVTVPLAEITVAVTTNGTTAAPNKTVYAVHAADTACPSGQVVTLGITSSTGTLNALLPYGAWKIATNATLASPPHAGWPAISTTSVSPITTAAVNLS